MNPLLRRFRGGASSGGGGGIGMGVSYGDGIVMGDSTSTQTPRTASLLINVGTVTDIAVAGQASSQQQGAYQALSSGTRSGAKWVIIQTGLNDDSYFATVPLRTAEIIRQYQVMVDAVRAGSPTAKIIISNMNPPQPWYVARGAPQSTERPAMWAGLQQAIDGGGPTPITGVDARVTSQTSLLVDPALANGLNPIYQASPPSDVHQNPTGTAIIADAWQGGLAKAFGVGPTHAYNSARYYYFGGTQPFINKVKTGGGFQGTTGPLNADGWPTAIPAGGGINFLIAQELSAYSGWFPPGNYQVKCSNTSLTLSMLGSPGISSVVSGAGVCTFTSADMGTAWDTLIVKITISNATGSTQPLSALSCCLVAEQPMLDAGAIFSPAYIAAHQGAQSIRFKDWMYTDEHAQAIKHFSDYGSQAESKPYYADLTAGRGVYAPISVLMKFAMQLGAKPWISVPFGSGAVWFTTTVADSTIHCLNQVSSVYVTAFAHGLAEGDPFMISGGAGAAVVGVPPLLSGTVYYAKNVTSTTLKASTTAFGSAITFTGSDTTDQSMVGYANIYPLNGDPYTDLWLPLATACYAADPTATIYVEPGNEVWNFGYSGYTECVGPVNYRADGTVGNAGHGYSWAAWKMWKAFESVYPPSQIIRVVSSQTSYPEGALTSIWDYVDSAGIIEAGADMKTILSHSLSRSCYAAAPYVNIESLTPDGYGGHTSHNSNSIYTELGTDVVTNANWDTFFNRGITTVGGYMTHLKAYLEARTPGLPITFYEWGHQVFYGGQDPTHGLPINLSLKSYLETQPGADMYARALAVCAFPYNVRVNCHYWGVSGATVSPGAFSYWPVQNRETVDVPRSKYFRSI